MSDRKRSAEAAGQANKKKKKNGVLVIKREFI
jgi:hypothetical protein